MKNDRIEKICNLPLDFNNGNKSVLVLLNESQFLLYHEEISVPGKIN
jgi:hypothetical protein